MCEWLSDKYKQTVVDDYGESEQASVIEYVAPGRIWHHKVNLRCYPFKDFNTLIKFLHCLLVTNIYKFSVLPELLQYTHDDLR